MLCTFSNISYSLWLTTVVFIAKAYSSNENNGIWTKLKHGRTMQNVCLVTMQEVWTPEANNGLLYKPHLQFLAQNLIKKVWLINKSLQ